MTTRTPEKKLMQVSFAVVLHTREGHADGGVERRLEYMSNRDVVENDISGGGAPELCNDGCQHTTTPEPQSYHYSSRPLMRPRPPPVPVTAA